MIDHGEIVLAEREPDQALVDVAEEICERLQAGEELNVRDFVKRYPQWAGAILKLLPTMHELVHYGQTVDRERRLDQRPKRETEDLCP